MAIDTDHGPFVDLISGQGRVFAVPPYQRAYSWKASKQVAELWGDILRLYVHLVDDGQRDPHFIGSVVTGAAESKALGPAESPVIDGQQRLMTLSLIVAAVRDVLVTDDDAKSAITSQYLAHMKGTEIAAIRVKPGQHDLAVFEQIMRGEDVTDTRNLVYKAYAYITERLHQGPTAEEDPDDPDEASERIDEDDEAEEFEDEVEGQEELPESNVDWDWEQLLSVIGTQLELVSITGVPPESAYQIFATLNSKGMPLSQVDLTRNAVFMLLPTMGQKAHKDLWLPMEATMGKDLLQSYLHSWVIRRGHNVPAKETYSSAVQELSRPGYKEPDVRRILKELHSGAWAYLLVTRPLTTDRNKFGTGPSVPKGMTTSLARLRQWGNVPMEPVLLEIAERFRSSTLSSAQVGRLLSYLESFVVRRFVAQIPPNDLRSTFGRLTQQIRKKTTPESFERAILAGLAEPLRRWPTDPELRQALRARALYRPKGQKQTFFVLKRLAEAFEGKEAPQIVLGTTATDYSIEHVMPQHLTDEWRADMSRWGDRKPQETWDLFVHVAGNLTLTAYNSELSDHTFAKKKKWIKDHLRLELSKAILNETVWTRKEIRNRSDSLADKAVSLWPYPTLR